MSSIKHIIFDFGNVLINLDFDLTRIEFAKLLTIEGAYHTRKKLFEEGHSDLYEIGAISENEFFDRFRKCAEREDLSNEGFKQAWLALLQDIPAQRIEMLKELRKNYGVYMLSNINHSHATQIHTYLRKEHNITEYAWRSHFDTMYYSHEIGHRKPEESIYQFLLDDSGLKPDECLFIDDLEENILAARNFGINGYHHNPKEDISEILPRILKEKLYL